MTNKEIKELLEIFKDSGVTEMEVQRGENRLRLRRGHTAQELVVTAPAPVAAPAPAPAPAPVAAPLKPSAPDPNEAIVKSPIVGTYYEAPAPDAPSFVKVGDRVEVGQVLCIIESMKLMNEIEAEVAGIVTAKLVENGRPVEYGEALFSIRR
jgi:acetyl-CoA carboxylase biotin carboxyl carrier protein